MQLAAARDADSRFGRSCWSWQRPRCARQRLRFGRRFLWCRSSARLLALVLRAGSRDSGYSRPPSVGVLRLGFVDQRLVADVTCSRCISRRLPGRRINLASVPASSARRSRSASAQLGPRRRTEPVDRRRSIAICGGRPSRSCRSPPSRCCSRSGRSASRSWLRDRPSSGSPTESARAFPSQPPNGRAHFESSARWSTPPPAASALITNPDPQRPFTASSGADRNTARPRPVLQPVRTSLKLTEKWRYVEED